MTWPKITDSRTLADRLIRLSAVSAATIEDIPADVEAEFEYIEKHLISHSAEERSDAYRLICNILEDIAAAKRKGKSNFLFFKFLKLKKALSNSLAEVPAIPDPKRLDKRELYSEIISDDFQAEKTEFPDSLFQFIEIGQKSKYFQAISYEGLAFPDSMPVVFVLNWDTIARAMVERQSVNVISGHCIMGFEPHEDKLSAFLSAVDRGLLLHDLFVYHHVLTWANYLRGRLSQILVNLDTIYYHQKIYQTLDGSLSPNEVHMLVNRMAVGQSRVIQQILPQSHVLFEHEPSYKAQLERIVANGLREFVVGEVQEYMGYDLARHPDKARALAYVAATYLYSPLILRQPAIAVESALNVETPARVVLPYLELQKLQHLFSFIALIPLPDVKMSHGAMYYGDATQGKIYSADSHDRIKDVILEMSCNWVRPNRCWFVHYFLAKSNTVPDDSCHSTVCQVHQDELFEDLLDVLAQMQPEGDA